jgi:hypothetical protein
MRPPTSLRPWLWLLGTLTALALGAGLTIFILRSTTFSLDTAERRATTETALGDVSCRKTLSAEFPFVRLECRESAPP